MADPARTSWSPPLVAFAAWLLPGGGYLLIGQRARGVVVGVTILLLSALRLLWRLRHPPPPLPSHAAATMPRWQRTGYRASHALMYLLVLAVPLFGWAYSSTLGVPVVWFGVLPLPDLMPVDKELAEAVLKPLHKGSAFTLAAVALLHVAAVLKHHWIDRDGILKRMWPAPRQESAR